MISVDNVNCRGRLTYVTLEFPAAAKVGVMGRSGAGKSSLISVLTGQLFPDSGTVTMPSGGIGYIPQDPGTTLLPNRPAVDSICEFARDCVGDVPEVLASLGLDPQLAERRPSELSGDQRPARLRHRPAAHHRIAGGTLDSRHPGDSRRIVQLRAGGAAAVVVRGRVEALPGRRVELRRPHGVADAGHRLAHGRTLRPCVADLRRHRAGGTLGGIVAPQRGHEIHDRPLRRHARLPSGAVPAHPVLRGHAGGDRRDRGRLQHPRLRP